MNKIRKLIFLITIALSSLGNSFAQENVHFIFFKNKDNNCYSLNQPLEFLSQKSVSRRERQAIKLSEHDLPVSPYFLDSLKKLDISIIKTSRWLNGALVKCDSLKLKKLFQTSFVLKRKVTFNKAVLSAHENTSFVSMKKVYNRQFEMIGLDQMHNDGFKGEGMLIAVLDGGFTGVDTLGIFRNLFANEQIKGTYDFVTNDKNVYHGSSHGSQVFSLLGANSTQEEFTGSAPKADYLLLRTEDVSIEDRKEEVLWLLAAEYADSAGADVINSSIGYNTFDDSDQNYTYENLDGKTTIITNAANYAAAAGMLVVVSAGNEGTRNWRYMLAPGDSDSVLTIGSVDEYENHAAFSSVGPTYDGRIKPDLVAMGQGVMLYDESGRSVSNSGTSFSCPIVAGLATGIWQAYPNLSNMQLLDIMRKSGSQFNNPDNQKGYGIPSYASVILLLPNIEKEYESFQAWNVENVIYFKHKYPNELNISLTNIMGKVIFRATIKKSEDQLNIRDIPSGIYIITANDGNRELKKKVFITQ